MDFLISDYKRIIDELRDHGYHFIGYDEAGRFEKEAILRHDVDVSTEKALELAEYESQWGVKSTYYFLLNSHFYNMVNKRNVEIVKKIHALGHSVGLHFDETNYQLDETDATGRNQKVQRLILKEKNLFEQLLEDVPVKSVSMHIPSKATLEANLHFEDGFINSYAYEFFKGYKYVSDSEMRWRENVWEIIASGEYNKLHVLTHPIWYDTELLKKEEKVKNFLIQKKEESFENIKVIVPRIDNELNLNSF